MKNHWISNRRQREFAQITDHLSNKFDLIRTKLNEMPDLYKLSIHQAMLHIGTVVRMRDNRWLLYSYQPDYKETDLGEHGSTTFYLTLEDALKKSLLHAGLKLEKAA